MSGTYGFVHGGTDSGTPIIGLSQATFDSTTGTYTGEVTENTDGVVSTDAHLSAWTTRYDIGMEPSATLLVVGFR